MRKYSLVLVLTILVAHSGFGGDVQSPTIEGPATHLHYAPSTNFDSSGAYLPRRAGFNLADVSSLQLMPYVPVGVKALVFLNLCNGADKEFVDTVASYIQYREKVFGFYLMDEPDPTGRHNPPCTARNLKDEADWIHLHVPEAKTFFVLLNRGRSTAPDYTGTYTVETTHVDLFGIDPYPCRTELNGCNYEMIRSYVDAATRWGIPKDRIVPVYQTFGFGEWKDDSHGRYILPSPSQMEHMMRIWKELVPNPTFDYAYSWGSQKSDQSLMGSSSLQAVFTAHNR